MVEGVFQELAFWDLELSLQGPYAEFTKKRLDPLFRKEDFPTSMFDAIVPLLEQRFGSVRPFKCIELGMGPCLKLGTRR